MPTITTIVSSSSGVNYNGAGTRYVVQANNGALYLFYVDNASDVVYKKSVDGGITWATAVAVFTGSATGLAIWYDRWSGISGDLIHCAYIESASDDVLYRSVNTSSSDALSTETVIGAATTTASGGAISIARMRGGNLLCAWCIDAGAEYGVSRSVDAGANWTARATATGLEGATTDQWILLPGWALDNQDAMMFFWDADADEISRKLYDDSGDAWAETSIAATMVDIVATTSFPHFAATVDITNSRNLLVAWSAIDTLNADLRCWHVTESAITEVTNVVLNSTDDQGFCAIGIDTATEDWYVIYGGASGGGETYESALNIYYKVSTDDGATWGAETAMTNTAFSSSINGLFCTPRFATNKTVNCVSASAGGPNWVITDVSSTTGARVIGG